MVTFTGDDVPAMLYHSTHQHGLKLVATEKLFQCDGCRQIGDKHRYRCEQCDFDLHVCCAQAAPARFEHSMFEGRALTFFHSRPRTPPGSLTSCDVCGDPVLGFLYHSLEHNLDLHPFCAVMPKRIGEDGGRVLELHKITDHDCGLCGKVGGEYLAYRFQDNDGTLVYLHVACMIEAIYSSDIQFVQANSTTTGEVSARTPTTGELDTVQNTPRRRSKFRLICKVAFRVAKLSATQSPL